MSDDSAKTKASVADVNNNTQIESKAKVEVKKDEVKATKPSTASKDEVKELAADLKKTLTIQSDKISDKNPSDTAEPAKSTESASESTSKSSDVKNDIPEQSDSSQYEETDQDSDEIIQQMASNSATNDPG